jgi:pectinesterase
VTVGSGYITASGRASNDAGWYVINNSNVSGTATGVRPDLLIYIPRRLLIGWRQTSYLGRPWRDYARVVFQNTYLHSNILAAGWSQWSSATPNTDHITFAEYKNTGTGASGTRASFATKLSAAVSMSTVLGSSKPSWIDASFL